MLDTGEKGVTIWMARGGQNGQFSSFRDTNVGNNRTRSQILTH